MSPEENPKDEPQYRVFISYSHQDHDHVMKIVEILEENGLKPMWDRNFAFGYGFHEQIKNFIAHAHVFLPVITPTSDEKKWVHQEIGYAMALNIPMLPVALGKLPGEMLQQIHAVQLSEGESVEQLKKHLRREKIVNLVHKYSHINYASYQCAEFAEERAKMLADYCNEVQALDVLDFVRQKGGLSSLHIPAKTIYHPVWNFRYGKDKHSFSHCYLQRNERIAIETHARSAGCRLIINPEIPFKEYGDKARIVRLECLLEFLESMPDSKCQVAIHSDMDPNQNVTILGDWFYAESVSAQIGYRQTIFTKHAPSMLEKIEAFDLEFKEHLEARGWSAETSRAETIMVIRNRIAELKREKT